MIPKAETCSFDFEFGVTSQTEDQTTRGNYKPQGFLPLRFTVLKLIYSSSRLK